MQVDAPLKPSLEQLQDFAYRDRYFYAHLTSMIDELQRKDSHLLAFPTTLLPELLRLGTAFKYVRHCLCAIAATQLACITKSAPLTYAGYQYRGLGLRGLRESMSQTGPRSLEGVLAASLLLSWGAIESEEYMHTMQGVCLAIKEMASSAQQSTLLSMMQASHSSAVLDMPQPASVVRTLEIAFSALLDLTKRLGKGNQDHEIVRGFKELCNYVSNLRMAAVDNRSVTEQMEAIFPIRNWILWMPNGFNQLYQRNPLTMLFIAYYEMVHLAVGPLLPAISTPLSVGRRVDFIDRIDAQFIGMRRDSTVSEHGSFNALGDWNDLMFGPRAYAMIYRQRTMAGVLSVDQS